MMQSGLWRKLSQIKTLSVLSKHVENNSQSITTLFLSSPTSPRARLNHNQAYRSRSSSRSLLSPVRMINPFVVAPGWCPNGFVVAPLYISFKVELFQKNSMGDWGDLGSARVPGPGLSLKTEYQKHHLDLSGHRINPGTSLPNNFLTQLRNPRLSAHDVQTCANTG